VKPVRVAVIGAGYWGKKLVYEYTSAQCNKGNVRLAGVCDLSPTALAFCKEKFSVKENLLTSSAEDLIADSKISAVHIATPNQTHYELAKMALEAGKDVLVEKPMTLGSREAYELVDLAASHELVLHVGHIFRFNSALNKAREILNKGSIGKTFYARIQWTDSQYFPDRDIIFDLGPHPVDVLNQLLDSWPTQVSGFARGYRNSKDHDEIAYGLAEFDNEIFAHIELSWLHPRKVREASIVGSEGGLIVDCLHQRLTLHSAGSTTEVSVSANNTIESEIGWFVDCVGRRCLDVESGLIGARTVEVLEAMRKSIWERPLPIVQPVQHDHTAAMVRILQSINDGLDQSAFATSLNMDNTRSDKYLQMMSKLGLIRTTVTLDSVQYEVTETGLHFLNEYGDIVSGSVKRRLQSRHEALSESR
jgi:predicted dehydrogenase/predicted transcriptional regulator